MDEHQRTPAAAAADDSLQTSRYLPSLSANVEYSGANLHNVEASDILPKFSPVQALQMVEPQGFVHTGLTQFKYLPPEIRSMIWQFSHDYSPRLVYVYYDRVIGKFITCTPPPIQLQICRESRALADKVWPLQFGTLGHPASVRANLEVDFVQLDWDPLSLNILRDTVDISHIRRLWIILYDKDNIGGEHIDRLGDRLAATGHCIVITVPPPGTSGQSTGEDFNQPQVWDIIEHRWRKLVRRGPNA